ncbi:DUF2188 domain-containing protein [Alkalibacterium olivapovliticus]|uniref:Uncharacterized protein YdaT n=1 Tax=Alkalibacterium olivapovliticus TaxID=99907 RepID=A0A2T0W967_9LACT|nr:DUF2188 domain-containing protein [Alkalibacterium olivapovliticus]PRY83251.1 uncharacterized protein YdaT [Alkalibacterium olivapovliticus]
MPWDLSDYPDSFKNFDHVVKKKAIDIANALLDNGYDEGRAIPIATKQAKEWADNASEEELRSYKHGEAPKKEDEHDDKSNEELLDNDVMVYYEEDEWKVRTKDAKRPDSTFDNKNDAVSRANEIADNKESQVITFTKDGKRQ